MTAAVFVHIAKYFETMHNHVWKQAQVASKEQPVPVDPYDRLPELQRALLQSYMGAVELFDPLPRPCTSDDECSGQTERCVNGECRTPISNFAAELVRRCDSDDDCDGQKEICVNGYCWRLPFDVTVPNADFTLDPGYQEHLERELFDYYARIQHVLTAGLGRKPRKILEVREYLMLTYANILAAAGWRRRCEKDDDCPHQNHRCIKGYCVPIPFPLVPRPFGKPFSAPWTL